MPKTIRWSPAAPVKADGAGPIHISRLCCCNHFGDTRNGFTTGEHDHPWLGSCVREYFAVVAILSPRVAAFAMQALNKPGLAARYVLNCRRFHIATE